MADDVRLRDGRIEDCQAVLELWDRAYETSSNRSAAQDIPALLACALNSRLILAEVEDRIAGSLIVTFDGWRGNMYRLAVDPLVQRRGIAGLLVQEAHTWLQGIGCKRITALVESEHEYATRFWESVGYHHDKAMRRYSLDLS